MSNTVFLSQLFDVDRLLQLITGFFLPSFKLCTPVTEDLLAAGTFETEVCGQPVEWPVCSFGLLV